MKVLVTGGAGYVGSVLLPLLLENGCSVTVLDNLRFGGHGLLPYFLNPRFHFINGDIRDERTVKDALKGVDMIVHLAAIVGFPACKKEPSVSEEINYGGTVLLNRLRSTEQPVIFASTGSNYGAVPNGVCTEETSLNPLTIYGKTKTMAEQVLLDSKNAIVYRFATAFGLSLRLRLDLLINDFVFQALKKNFLLIYEKEFRRTFIHVRDMARSFMFAIDHFEQMNGNVYNVGSENMNISKEEMALCIKKYIDYFLEFAGTGEDPDKRDYEVSYEKIRKVGFHTTINLEDGIKELIRGLKVVEIFNPYSNV